MNEINIIGVNTTSEINQVVDLGDEIWKEHYTPIIGSEQVNYMLEKFQSVPAVQNQIQDGYSYFLIRNNKVNIGYLSVQPRENVLFLSKIYLLKNFRGLGLFSFALKFIEEIAIDQKLSIMQLTVNKHNTKSISAYEAKGFIKIKSAVFDIGNGFVMDDFVMEKSL